MEAVLLLIQELATYEKAAGEVIQTAETLRRDGFGERPLFDCMVAIDTQTEEMLGMALTYIRYSTWKGPVLYLEDLVVKEEFRRKGIGKALLTAVIEHAKAGGYERVTWQVLDWNAPAIDFYRKLGAELDPTWINCHLPLLEKNHL